MLILLLFLQLASYGQKPSGIFLTDSVEVGKPVYFSLSIRHKPDTEVFFPDTSYNFSPFEIISKTSFVSSTNEKGTLDSAVYHLVSFDVSNVQSLRMPVYIFNKKDCTAVFTEPDSLFLIRSNVFEKTEKPVLVAETGLLPLSSQFNFSVLIGSVALIIGFIGSIYWVFGQDIYKQWQLIKLQRRHLEYLRSFNRLMRNAREKNNIKDAEKAIIVWKNYLERLEKKPFATYTTREIVDNMPDDALAEALKNMDGIIYGQVISKNMHTYLEVLKAGATRIYQNKRRFILDSPVI
ncbi:hypothetical protein FEM33_05370 [Dyadobacter flavalbus]|uniref:Uncharacterized protein n=1 Tax=Dyadobacter flavalbus TaxID=2579942 RepID=A0A5M8QX01_9BACT|nr:hypothetical protein FEM33_05370 [Dyadobacter flavalbus]